MAPKLPFTIKDENIYVYELEVNDAYEFDKLTPEQQKKVTDTNATWLENLQPILLDKGAPCQCLMPEIAERVRRRAALMPNAIGPGGQISFKPEQSDVDKKDFAVIVDEKDGIYGNIRFIATHCKKCGALQFWGDLSPIATLVAKAFVDHDVAKEKDKTVASIPKGKVVTAPDTTTATTSKSSPTFVLEDINTGKLTDADNLMKGLTGGK